MVDLQEQGWRPLLKTFVDTEFYYQLKMANTQKLSVIWLIQ